MGWAVLLRFMVQNLYEEAILPTLRWGKQSVWLAASGSRRSFRAEARTHCIARELMDHIHSVIYVTSSQLFDILGSREFDTDPEKRQAGALLDECELLIIDDLGTELTNSFTVSQLFICLNDRILQKKSTIISTNLSLNEIKSIYSERTFSRISSNYRLLKLAGDDIRIKKKLMK